MSTVEILPFEGVGPIRFGMTLEQARARVPDLTDAVNGRLWSDALHAYIDVAEGGGVEGVEFAIYDYEPTPHLDGVVLRGTLGDISEALEQIGWACARGSAASSDTVFVLKAGVTLWTEDDEEKVQAVGIWRRGHLSKGPPEWGTPSGVE